MLISEFCGLTISDIDFEHHLINIDHQLQFTAKTGKALCEPQSAVFL